MAYKTIFTPLTEFRENAPELTFAVALAEAHDSHLDVLCLGVDRTPTTYFEVGSNAVIMHAAIEEAHARADEIREKAEAHLRNTGVRWEAINGVTSSAALGRTVAAQTQYTDLALIAQPYVDEQTSDAVLVLEGLLFETDCPALIVPEGNVSVWPDSIVVAWNESREAMRAVRAALPFLRAADTVHIAIIDPPGTGPERSDPGGALAVYLSRHGVNCDIQVIARQGMSFCERLSHHLIETGADMLVMGGYGHSRFREAVLGGATRDMLEQSNIPVLMAH